jgi:hypothetical protein
LVELADVCLALLEIPSGGKRFRRDLALAPGCDFVHRF